MFNQPRLYTSRKIQVPSSKHQPIFNSQVPKQKVAIWNLLFRASLVLGDWDLVLADEEARHGR
jgi:hypothetical protein